MRAAVIADGSIAAGDRPTPVPSDEELLVRVIAAGLNGADIGQRAGRYPPPDSFTDPSIPGLEVAGEVVAHGARVRTFIVGELVMGLVPGGGQAEFVTLHERHAMRIPDTVGPEAAGGFPECFATAHDALFSQAGLAPGDRVLINGAAGGVGLAAVQLAHAAGAEVVASVRHPPHRPALAAMGATALDPNAAFDAGPFDVVLELVGGPNLARDLEALNSRGRIAVIGTGGGTAAQFDLSMLMRRRARVFGSMLRARSLEEKALVTRRLEQHVLPLLASGKVIVPIEATFPLTDVAAAYERFTAGAKLGKVIVLP